MAGQFPFSGNLRGRTLGTVASKEEVRVRDLTVLVVFIAMLVGPAFAALNIFVEKNRI